MMACMIKYFQHHIETIITVLIYLFETAISSQFLFLAAYSIVTLKIGANKILNKSGYFF